MSAQQDLPVTGAPAAAAGLIGGLALALGTLLMAAARWGAKARRRSR